MTDYAEEQRQEIEALESIYMDELTLVAVEPYHSFEIFIQSQCEIEGTENANCVIQFTYTPTYPDEPPEFDIISYENLEEEHIEALKCLMKEQAEENLGMGMIFTLISAAQENLTDTVEEISQKRIEDAERLQREAEQAERERFEGTRVTIETFMAWKAKFDADLSDLSRIKGKASHGPKKLTGKELFLTGNTMDDSDVQFLEEDGGETVQVDESLFQDMDDLDLDDELAEDLED